MGFDDRSPGFARQSERPVGMAADLVLVQKAQIICAANPGIHQTFKENPGIQRAAGVQAEGWLRVRVVTCTVLGG